MYPVSASEAVELSAETSASEQLSVVVCGSFRRGRNELKADVRELEQAGCVVLSPRDPDFVAEIDGFAYARHELDLAPPDIERAHLDALYSADLVWAHLPEGYLGPSAAFELGVARAAGIPIYARHRPADVGLCEFVQPASSPARAVELRRHKSPDEAGAGLQALQRYYMRAAVERGWANEGPADCMLLMTEEVGELARAVRLRAGLARTKANGNDVGEELADVQLYVLHLANILGIDLAAAVSSKESENFNRFRSRREQAA
jgi:NTP pyrophosphatase (non-canonical NTP hydrolase)